MNTHTIRILTAARERIAKGWCQRAFARDREGNKVGARSKKAVSFCAIGAIRASTRSRDRRLAANIALAAAVKVEDLSIWNDSACKVTSILAGFDKAIKEHLPMYTHTNFKTKSALKAAVAAGERVTVYQPGPFGGNEPTSGTVFIEGPHFPEPHKWYAKCELENGQVVKVQ